MAKSKCLNDSALRVTTVDCFGSTPLGKTGRFFHASEFLVRHMEKMLVFIFMLDVQFRCGPGGPETQFATLGRHYCLFEIAPDIAREWFFVVPSGGSLRTSLSLFSGISTHLSVRDRLNKKQAHTLSSP